MTPVVVALAERQRSLASKVASAIGGDLRMFSRSAAAEDDHFRSVSDELQRHFAEGAPIVAIMSVGIVVRALAPLLRNKGTEPPVLAMSEDGAHVVPVLGGHRGANALALEIADAIGADAAVTTAGEVSLGVALDEPPVGYTLASGDAKSAMASILNGANVIVDPTLDWASHLIRTNGTEPAVALRVENAGNVHAQANELVYQAKQYVLGVGCERGADAAELDALVATVLGEADISADAIALIASADLKADEACIHAVAGRRGIAARFIDRDALAREEDRLASPSETVRAEVGVPGVAEAGALSAVGPDGELVVPKRKSRRCTAALARASGVLDPRSIGQARGRLAVVGLGPGSAEWRTPAATDAIRSADIVVGYSLYLDLCADLIAGERHDYPLGAEEDRVRAALTFAATGQSVALVCSGDPGIYAMAALVFEVLDAADTDPALRRTHVRIVPGVSALQGAAAISGAPLGHDFCAISLSDLLTPWEAIERRVVGASAADFVIAFYNPVSRRRTRQFDRALEILRGDRPPGTPVILASNIAREAEEVRVTTLGEVRVEDIDMLTTVIVGSTQSRMVERGDGTVRVYTPRGYAAKTGSALARERADA